MCILYVLLVAIFAQQNTMQTTYRHGPLHFMLGYSESSYCRETKRESQLMIDHHFSQPFTAICDLSSVCFVFKLICLDYQSKGTNCRFFKLYMYLVFQMSWGISVWRSIFIQCILQLVSHSKFWLWEKWDLSRNNWLAELSGIRIKASCSTSAANFC